MKSLASSARSQNEHGPTTQMDGYDQEFIITQNDVIRFQPLQESQPSDWTEHDRPHRSTHHQFHFGKNWDP